MKIFNYMSGSSGKYSILPADR